MTRPVLLRRIVRRITLLGLSAALALPAQSQQDPAGLADELVRRLRAVVEREGALVGDLADTARLLDALARSPRRYTELDGPFMRVPLRRLARAGEAGPGDALVSLGLSGGLTREVVEVRTAAAARLRSGPQGDLYTWALALHTYHPGASDLPAPPPDADAGLACLLAADPAAVAAPSVTEVGAWTRWARAARLRGLRPQELPELPTSRPEADFEELLGQLETAIQMHGLWRRPSQVATGADDAAPDFVPPGQDLESALARAWNFLDSLQQEGRFGLVQPGWDGPEPGVTAMALRATIQLADRLGRDRPDWVDSGLDYLVSLQQPDGAIQLHGLDVYTTSVAIETLVAARREQDTEVIVRARDFLLATQSDEGEGYDSVEDAYYGGVGYGGDERPDLSNTQMAIEAVVLAGADPEDPFFRKALVFLERCQNFGETAPSSWPRPQGGRIVSGTDGGGTYMPGNSVAGEWKLDEDTWSPRSYGSMTYALTKSYMLCGLPPDHPRVEAATDWIARNFSVDTNPGYPDEAGGAQGLYYYYLVMARTLALRGAEELPSPDGGTIDWRSQLSRRLLDTQRTDGSWINERSPRWWEGAPTLATAYALLTLHAIGG